MTVYAPQLLHGRSTLLKPRLRKEKLPRRKLVKIPFLWKPYKNQRIRTARASTPDQDGRGHDRLRPSAPAQLFDSPETASQERKTAPQKIGQSPVPLGT